MSLKVYYLDDEADLLEAFFDAYNSQAVSVKTFQRPEELYEAVKQDVPDLIFIDYRLPGTTGDQVALNLNPDIKKILVTGDLNIEHKGSFYLKIEKPLKRDKVRGLFNQLQN
ncbi:MAG: response regulator [Bacteriovoracaceae bacterium]